MRKNAKIIAFVLVAVLMFSLTACGKNSAKSIVGTWKAEISAADMYGMNEEELIKSGVSADALKFSMTYAFSEDGTLTVTTGNESMGTTSQTVKYKAENGRLYTAPDEDSEISEETYTVYEFSDNSLVFTKVGPEDATEGYEEILAAIYPIKFTKID